MTNELALMESVAFVLKRTPEELLQVAAALKAAGGAKQLIQDARFLVKKGASVKDTFDLLAAESECPRREALSEIIRDLIKEKQDG